MDLSLEVDDTTATKTCAFSFFISSRRRHTGWPRDWSSDVCSSDLAGADLRVADRARGQRHVQVQQVPAEARIQHVPGVGDGGLLLGCGLEGGAIDAPPLGQAHMQLGLGEDRAERIGRPLDIGQAAALVGRQCVGAGELDQEQVILDQVVLERGQGERPLAELLHEGVVGVALPLGAGSGREALEQCGRGRSVHLQHPSASANSIRFSGCGLSPRAGAPRVSVRAYVVSGGRGTSVSALRPHPYTCPHDRTMFPRSRCAVRAMVDLLWGGGGMAGLLLIALALSSNRRAIRLRTVLGAFALQVLLGVLVLYWGPGQWALERVSTGFQAVIDTSGEGIDFLFGPLLPDEGEGSVFALQVLPVIIFFASLTAVLYHWKILPRSEERRVG